MEWDGGDATGGVEKVLQGRIERNNSTCESPTMNALRRPLLSLPRYACQYTNSNVETLHSPRHTSPQLQVRHEVNKETTTLNVPPNPLGGGSGGSMPGGGALSFTSHPILDALLTTAIGLGAGKSICTLHLTILTQNIVP